MPFSGIKTYIGKLLPAENEDGLVDLKSKSLGGNKAQGGAIDLDKASALLDEGYGSRSSLFLQKQ